MGVNGNIIHFVGKQQQPPDIFLSSLDPRKASGVEGWNSVKKLKQVPLLLENLFGDNFQQSISCLLSSVLCSFSTFSAPNFQGPPPNAGCSADYFWYSWFTTSPSLPDLMGQWFITTVTMASRKASEGTDLLQEEITHLSLPWRSCAWLGRENMAEPNKQTAAFSILWR